MWFSIFLVCVHDLPNIRLQATAFISPVFVAFLLTKVSGIPLLEKAADKKWGNLKTYQEYKRTTSVLILLPKLG
jgi:steroid 5-alpha reductase family enzyme